MFDAIKEWIFKVLKSRLFVFWIVILVLFSLVVQRLFYLQIVKGSDYLNNFTLSIEKTVTSKGTRGNIYDRNGILLAYNELSYTVTIEDSGTYETNKERIKSLNDELDRLIGMIESCGDSIVNDFNLYMSESGEVSFLVEGNSLQRFRADVYGRSSVDDLVVNEKLGYNEATATPEQVLEYLLDKYSIDPDTFGTYRAYQIMLIRNALSQYSYQKYISTDVALDVSDETVAMIKEHSYELEGVEVKEDTKRIYNYPEYFSHIVGYTGKISTDEYNVLSQEDDTYNLSDVVGKSGIEEALEQQLQGDKGEKTLYVSNTGKILEVKSETESSAGNDVYLSIDAKLQIAVYDLLEQELAGILVSKITNEKVNESKDVYIPIYDVYCALIENSVIDLDAMAEAKEGTYQYKAQQVFLEHEATSISSVEAALNSDKPFSQLSEEMQEYVTYVVSMIQNNSVFQKTAVDSNDEIYKSWKKGEVSVKKYLKHAIEESWIDITALKVSEKYSDTDEIYSVLVDYITDKLQNNDNFDKIIYKYLIMNDEISGVSLCLILFEQGVLAEDTESFQKLERGVTSAYTFLKQKIQDMEIKPKQLALDPCTGSCVIIDPNTGETIACVSYPGYDTNRLANSMDAEYYSSLLNDGSLPLYNNATQQTTAPGSTFKMVTTAAGLTEHVIDTDTIVECTNSFQKLDYDLHCAIYPSAHGKLNTRTAIRDSCNVYFCEVGYLLSMEGENYNADKGLKALSKYAGYFGLDRTTGIEISENNSHVADEFPISAAIGQSNNSFTTIQLARYVAAIANYGTVYDLSLVNKVIDSNGETVSQYEPDVSNQITELSTSTWSAIHDGMELVVKSHEQFDDLEVVLAGKTGTAQEVETRPTHSLFVGYAPADSPEIAIAARIAYGYSSTNACYFVSDVMKYYFGQESEEELLNGHASAASESAANVID